MEDQQFAGLVRDVINLDQQKKSILAEYADEYRALDSNVSEAKKQRDLLALEIVGLNADKNTALSLIDVSKAQAEKIVADANTEMLKIINEASSDASKTRAEANAIKSEALSLIELAKNSSSKADEKSKEANDLMKQAKEIKKEADVMIANAIAESNRSSAVLLVAEQKAKELAEKEESLSKAQDVLTMKQNEFNKKSDILDKQLSDANELSKVIDEKSKMIDTMKEEIENAKREANVVIEGKKLELSKQASNNKDRSDELDIGFIQLESLKADVYRKIAKLESLKSEILNNEEK